jgi:hypothetical protein
VAKPGIYEHVLKTSRIIDVGEKRIALNTRNCGDGRPRFMIYLPIERNDLWRLLWEKKVKVKVFIEIPEEELRRIMQGGGEEAKSNIL